MATNLKNLKSVRGSRITFFKNGKSLGTAFEDIYGGDYYPGVSLFKGSHVKCNFGPKFKYKPEIQDTRITYRPISDRVKELEVEQTMADMQFFTEHEGKLKIDNYFMSN